MSFELSALQNATKAHGPVVRIVVAQVEGSAPREVGTAMLVWATGQEGTIGGGVLEFEAANRARALLNSAKMRRLDHLPLGPALGQCCGGSVTLLSEVFDEKSLDSLEAKIVFARPAHVSSAMPLPVSRILSTARNQGILPPPALVNGWMVEPIAPGATPLWIYGAGHVGRALVGVITPLPDFVITWVDTGPERFPSTMPAGVACLPASQPHMVVAHAPPDAHHLILTYSHALDLDLCHALLHHGFASAGLIGSATKWARFRKRLAALGHIPEDINQINCPIGDKALGKHPQAIAVGVAAALLKNVAQLKFSNREVTDDAQKKRKNSRAVNT